MANAPDTRQCLQFPPLEPDELLAVLRVLAEEDFDVLMASQIRIALVRETLWRVLVPVEFAAKSNADKEPVRDWVKRAYKSAAGRNVGREAEQGLSLPMQGTVPPIEAGFALTLASGRDPDIDIAPEPDAKQVIAVLGHHAQMARVMADVIRHGRDVRTAGAHRLGDDQRVAFLVYTDNAEDYGSVSAYLRRDDRPARIFPLRLIKFDFAWLWLERSVPEPSEMALDDLSAILRKARGANRFPDAVSDIIAVRSAGAEVRIYCHSSETLGESPKAAEHIAENLDPIQPLDVAVIAIKKDEVASAELRDHIKALNRQVGYEVSLEPKPPGAARDVDLEPLLEQIEELNLQIDQITALGAPQRRLMRFNDVQLPAMIDGMRKLPPKALNDGSLRYAASHSAGRGEPAHYLLYDPSVTHMRLSEAYWRMQTDPHPMSYWLEPFVAEAQLRRPTKTQVFVPSGNFLVPSLAHFGGDVDETLRLVLGNMFDDQQPLMTDKGRSAFYVFTKSTSAHFRLEVEVLDGDAFAPLNQKLYWINDYLQLKSPIAVDPDRLAEVAAGLYEGESAKVLRGDLDDQVAELDKAWSEARDTITTQALDVIDAIEAEMDAVAARVSDLHRYLGKAGKEIRALEATAAAATRALRHADGVMDTLGQKDSAVAQARMTFEARMEAEFRLAETAIEDRQAHIKTLRERLQRIRSWGES